jgi:hypothetical protein
MSKRQSHKGHFARPSTIMLTITLSLLIGSLLATMLFASTLPTLPAIQHQKISRMSEVFRSQSSPFSLYFSILGEPQVDPHARSIFFPDYSLRQSRVEVLEHYTFVQASTSDAFWSSTAADSLQLTIDDSPPIRITARAVEGSTFMRFDVDSEVYEQLRAAEHRVNFSFYSKKILHESIEIVGEDLTRFRANMQRVIVKTPYPYQ